MMTLLPLAITGRVADPHWYWWIVLYFFVGGIAAGSFLIAAVVDLFTPTENRPVVRIGYLIAAPLTALCGLLLAVDLGQPLRFWHMLINTTTSQPAFKYWSPMSYGSWVLAGFGVASGITFVLTLASLRGQQLAHGPLGKLVAAIGALCALIFVSYTGVLLNATNQPIWGDTTLLGAVFAVSGISTGIAAIALILSFSRAQTPALLVRLERADLLTIAVELVLLLGLVALLAAAGAARGLIGGRIGLFFWGGVLVLGLLIPLGLYLRPRLLGRMTPALAATLALLGGFILRAVILFSAHA